MEAAPATAQSVPAQAAAERRRHARVSVSFFGTLRLAAGASAECLVLDLSLGGTKIMLGEALAIAQGDAVGLDIEKFGTFRTEAMWRRDKFVGLRFNDPPETIAAAFGNFLPPGE
ncbi:MAG TPA: PilZ domain-containing protein [Stellaceae bacterium]|nr:PilZ domain-containing protein [Stellaceae bacterium]